MGQSESKPQVLELLGKIVDVHAQFKDSPAGKKIEEIYIKFTNQIVDRIVDIIAQNGPGVKAIISKVFNENSTKFVDFVATRVSLDEQEIKAGIDEMERILLILIDRITSDKSTENISKAIGLLGKLIFTGISMIVGLLPGGGTVADLAGVDNWGESIGKNVTSGVLSIIRVVAPEVVKLVVEGLLKSDFVVGGLKKVSDGIIADAAAAIKDATKELQQMAADEAQNRLVQLLQGLKQEEVVGSMESAMSFYGAKQKRGGGDKCSCNVYGGFVGAADYNNSLSKYTKDMLVDDLVSSIESLIGKKVEGNQSEKLKALTKAIDDIDSSQLDGDKKRHKQICMNIGRLINDKYGQKIIDLTLNPNIICKNVVGLLKSLSTSVHAEFLYVIDGAEQALKNMNESVKFLNLIYDKVQAEAKDDSAIKVKRLSEIHKTIVEYLTLGINKIDNLINIAKAKSDDISAIKYGPIKDNERLVEAINESVPGSKSFADLMKDMLRSINATGKLVEQINAALKTVGKTMADYKNYKSTKDLFQELMKDYSEDKDFSEYLNAIKLLSDNMYNPIVMKQGGDDKKGTKYDVYERNIKNILKVYKKQFMYASEPLVTAFEKLISELREGYKNTVEYDQLKEDVSKLVSDLQTYFNNAAGLNQWMENLANPEDISDYNKFIGQLKSFKRRVAEVGMKFSSFIEVIDNLVKLVDNTRESIKKLDDDIEKRGAFEISGGFDTSITIPEVSVKNLEVVAKRLGQIKKSLDVDIYINEVRANMKINSTIVDKYCKEYDDITTKYIAKKINDVSDDYEFYLTVKKTDATAFADRQKKRMEKEEKINLYTYTDTTGTISNIDLLGTYESANIMNVANDQVFDFPTIMMTYCMSLIKEQLNSIEITTTVPGGIYTNTQLVESHVRKIFNFTGLYPNNTPYTSTIVAPNIKFHGYTFNQLLDDYDGVLRSISEKFVKEINNTIFGDFTLTGGTVTCKIKEGRSLVPKPFVETRQFNYNITVNYPMGGTAQVRTPTIEEFRKYVHAMKKVVQQSKATNYPLLMVDVTKFDMNNKSVVEFMKKITEVFKISYNTVHVIDKFIQLFTKNTRANLEVLYEIKTIFENFNVETGNVTAVDYAPRAPEPFADYIKKASDFAKKSILKTFISVCMFMGAKFGDINITKDLFMSPVEIYNNVAIMLAFSRLIDDNGNCLENVAPVAPAVVTDETSTKRTIFNFTVLPRGRELQRYISKSIGSLLEKFKENIEIIEAKMDISTTDRSNLYARDILAKNYRLKIGGDDFKFVNENIMEYINIPLMIQWYINFFSITDIKPAGGKSETAKDVKDLLKLENLSAFRDLFEIIVKYKLDSITDENFKRIVVRINSLKTGEKSVENKLIEEVSDAVSFYLIEALPEEDAYDPISDELDTLPGSENTYAYKDKKLMPSDEYEKVIDVSVKKDKAKLKNRSAYLQMEILISEMTEKIRREVKYEKQIKELIQQINKKLVSVPNDTEKLTKLVKIFNSFIITDPIGNVKKIAFHETVHVLMTLLNNNIYILDQLQISNVRADGAQPATISTIDLDQINHELIGVISKYTPAAGNRDYVTLNIRTDKIYDRIQKILVLLKGCVSKFDLEIASSDLITKIDKLMLENTLEKLKKKYETDDLAGVLNNLLKLNVLRSSLGGRHTLLGGGVATTHGYQHVLSTYNKGWLPPFVKNNIETYRDDFTGLFYNKIHSKLLSVLGINQRSEERGDLEVLLEYKRILDKLSEEMPTGAGGALLLNNAKMTDLKNTEANLDKRKIIEKYTNAVSWDNSTGAARVGATSIASNIINKKRDIIKEAIANKKEEFKLASEDFKESRTLDFSSLSSDYKNKLRVAIAREKELLKRHIELYQFLQKLIMGSNIPSGTIDLDDKIFDLGKMQKLQEVFNELSIEFGSIMKFGEIYENFTSSFSNMNGKDPIVLPSILLSSGIDNKLKFGLDDPNKLIKFMNVVGVPLLDLNKKYTDEQFSAYSKILTKYNGMVSSMAQFSSGEIEDLKSILISNLDNVEAVHKSYAAPVTGISAGDLIDNKVKSLTPTNIMDRIIDPDNGLEKLIVDPGAAAVTVVFKEYYDNIFYHMNKVPIILQLLCKEVPLLNIRLFGNIYARDKILVEFTEVIKNFSKNYKKMYSERFGSEKPVPPNKLTSLGW